MYSSETIEPRSVRSVIGSTNGRSSQRRTANVSTSASSRLFMNAVKDASRSSRTTGEKYEENGSDRTSKRSYSPVKDYSKDDPKAKARKVESESSIDKYRIHETDLSHDKISRIKLERQSGDQGSYDVLQEEHDHSRYVNERRLSQQSTRQAQQPRSVLDRMVPNCPNSPRTCLYIHPASQDFNAYEQSGLYRQNSFGNGTGGQQLAFGFGPIGQDPMNHFVVGQSVGGFSGMGQNVFVPNSFNQNNIQQSPFSSNSLKQGASNNKIISVQGQRDIEQKLKSGSINSVTATVNTSTSITTTSRNVTTGSQDANLPQSSQALAVVCKYGELCANPNCMYAHSSPASVGTGTIPSPILDVPCKYGSECVNPKCHYSHPSPAN
ncbi:25419_t:CDS:2, partial [Gigaspora rosea]